MSPSLDCLRKNERPHLSPQLTLPLLNAVAFASSSSSLERTWFLDDLLEEVGLDLQGRMFDARVMSDDGLAFAGIAYDEVDHYPVVGFYATVPRSVYG